STIFTNPGYMQSFTNRWAYVDGYGNATTYTDGRARTRYNQVRQISSHNTYDSSPSIPYTLDQRVRSIEIDIHTGGSGPLAWPVYHETAGNVCSGSGALDDCLKDVAWWHSGHPLHEVITIFIDSPDDVFDTNETNSGRGVADFDTLLGQTLGSTNVYRPS